MQASALSVRSTAAGLWFVTLTDLVERACVLKALAPTRIQRILNAASALCIAITLHATTGLKKESCSDTRTTKHPDASGATGPGHKGAVRSGS